MCGRVYSTLSPETVAGLFGKATNVKGGEKCYTSFNAAPTRFMPLAKTTRSRAANKKKEIKKVDVKIEAMKWGMFIPNSTDIVINGRLEELVQKPFFRGLLEGKRAVVTI